MQPTRHSSKKNDVVSSFLFFSAAWSVDIMSGTLWNTQWDPEVYTPFRMDKPESLMTVTAVVVSHYGADTMEGR